MIRFLHFALFNRGSVSRLGIAFRSLNRSRLFRERGVHFSLSSITGPRNRFISSYSRLGAKPPLGPFRNTYSISKIKGAK